MMQDEPYSQEEVENIRQIAHCLSKMDTIFYTGHCTGKAAFDIMKEIIGDQLRLLHSGQTILDV